MVKDKIFWPKYDTCKDTSNGKCEEHQKTVRFFTTLSVGVHVYENKNISSKTLYSNIPVSHTRKIEKLPITA